MFDQKYIRLKGVVKKIVSFDAPQKTLYCKVLTLVKLILPQMQFKYLSNFKQVQRGYFWKGFCILIANQYFRNLCLSKLYSCESKKKGFLVAAFFANDFCVASVHRISVFGKFHERDIPQMFRETSLVSTQTKDI